MPAAAKDRTRVGRATARTATALTATALTATQLERRRREALPAARTLRQYYDALLLLRAYPPDAATATLVEGELKRIAAHLRRHRDVRRQLQRASLNAEGMPFVETVTTYSPDCIRWLLSHPHLRVQLDGFVDARLSLVELARLTLPRLERAEANAELSNDEVFDALKVREPERLAFVLAELSRLDSTPLVPDQLCELLGMQVRVTPTHEAFSTAFNRLPMTVEFYDPSIIRHFDATALMDAPLPPTRALSEQERQEVVQVIRNTMALNTRETDPATYLDARSLRVFDLARGVSIAIFTMTHNRQLALESYVGFTAFKNGLAVSYGGAWVFGARAEFGMNIFAPYRGGESGHVMCQLLRVYRQQFGVQYFEVDAHQFGQDNEEGIATGAFWFYWRYGFRPIDRALRAFAVREKARLAQRSGARSTRATLLKLAECNVALNFGGAVPRSVYDYSGRVTRLIAREYHGDRVVAEKDCVRRFLAAASMTMPRGADTREALSEIAMLARACHVTSHDVMQRLAELVMLKPLSVYRYQAALTNVLPLL